MPRSRISHAASIVILTVVVAAARGADAASAVRISQIYGAGGVAGAVYNQDYVELFNYSATPVNIGGWSVQYGSATGTGGLTVAGAIPAGSVIQPCGYFLVGLASGAAGAPLPAVPDAVAPAINLSAVSGKVAIVNVAAPLGTCYSANIVDLVGYGLTNCFEAEPADYLSATTSLLRLGGGMTDIDNNAIDFVPGGAYPRNRARYNLDCQAIGADGVTWGALKSAYR